MRGGTAFTLAGLHKGSIQRGTREFSSQVGLTEKVKMDRLNFLKIPDLHHTLDLIL